MPTTNYIFDANGNPGGDADDPVNYISDPGGVRPGVKPTSPTGAVTEVSANVGAGTFACSVTSSGYVNFGCTITGTAMITGAAQVNSCTFNGTGNVITGTANSMGDNTFNGSSLVNAGAVVIGATMNAPLTFGGGHIEGVTGANGIQLTIVSVNNLGGNDVDILDVSAAWSGMVSAPAVPTARTKMNLGAGWYYPEAKLPALNKVVSPTPTGLGNGTFVPKRSLALGIGMD